MIESRRFLKGVTISIGESLPFVTMHFDCVPFRMEMGEGRTRTQDVTKKNADFTDSHFQNRLVHLKKFLYFCFHYHYYFFKAYDVAKKRKVC